MKRKLSGRYGIRTSENGDVVVLRYRSAQRKDIYVVPAFKMSGTLPKLLIKIRATDDTKYHGLEDLLLEATLPEHRVSTNEFIRALLVEQKKWSVLFEFLGLSSSVYFHDDLIQALLDYKTDEFKALNIDLAIYRNDTDMLLPLVESGQLNHVELCNMCNMLGVVGMDSTDEHNIARALIARDDPAVTKHVMRRVSLATLPADITDSLKKHKLGVVREKYAIDTLNADDMNDMVNDPDAGVRRALASHNMLNDDIIIKLAGDTSPIVRVAVLQYQNINDTVFEMLRHDTNVKVIRALIRACIDTEHIEELCSLHRDHPNIGVRRVVAWWAPADIRTEMSLTDSDHTVRIAALTTNFCGKMSDLLRDGDKMFREQLVEHFSCGGSEMLIAALCYDECIRVRTEAIDSAYTEMDEDILTSIVGDTTRTTFKERIDNMTSEERLVKRDFYKKALDNA